MPRHAEQTKKQFLDLVTGVNGCRIVYKNAANEITEVVAEFATLDQGFAAFKAGIAAVHSLRIEGLA